MICRECNFDAGFHSLDCTWARDIGPRYYGVINTLAIYENAGDLEALRAAQDKLSELIAWASAYEIERSVIQKAAANGDTNG